MVRVTRNEAAARLGISKSTLDRAIKRGELTTETEQHGLRELVDLYRERMADADWRYQELLEQLKTMTKALPAGEPTAPKAKRRWWPFR